MTATTARHRLPLLAPGQAQKEMFHNEALSALDTLVHAAVESVGGAEPPAAPAVGQCWVVGPAPAGEWVGHAHALVAWTESGWRFHPPVAGMRAVVRETGLPVAWDGAAWRIGDVACARFLVGGEQVIGARQPAIASPAGGGTIDAEARGAIAAMLAALRAHGLIAP